MDPTKSGSLSVEKARVLPRIFDGRVPPTIVVAFGTAAAPAGAGGTSPGSVVVGRRFYIHDGDPFAKAHYPLPTGTEDTLLEAGIDTDLLGPVRASVAEAIQRRFIRPPVGMGPMELRLGDEFVSVGTINIVDYSKYKKVDPESLASFDAAARAPKAPKGLLAASVETTHSLIGLAARERGAAFAWVSGIANAVGAFDDVVAPREYAQNFAAAHNAGVVVTWLLPELVRRR